MPVDGGMPNTFGGAEQVRVSCMPNDFYFILYMFKSNILQFMVCACYAFVLTH